MGNNYCFVCNVDIIGNPACKFSIDSGSLNVCEKCNDITKQELCGICGENYFILKDRSTCCKKCLLTAVCKVSFDTDYVSTPIQTASVDTWVDSSGIGGYNPADKISVSVRDSGFYISEEERNHVPTF